MIPMNEKKRNYTPIVWTLTIAINALVIVLFLLPNKSFYEDYDFSFLPALNAVLNSITFMCLLMAFLFIKQKNIAMHKRFILMAFLSTSIFLLSYVLYHFTTPSTHFGGTGWIAYIYYFILITHVVLAAVIVPLALFSIGYGLNMEVEKHRKIARWTMPLWLYVSLTGVVVYLMLSPYYN